MVTARDTAVGSPKGEESGSERVKIPERSREAGPFFSLSPSIEWFLPQAERLRYV